MVTLGDKCRRRRSVSSSRRNSKHDLFRPGRRWLPIRRSPAALFVVIPANLQPRSVQPKRCSHEGRKAPGALAQSLADYGRLQIFPRLLHLAVCQRGEKPAHDPDGASRSARSYRRPRVRRALPRRGCRSRAPALNYCAVSPVNLHIGNTPHGGVPTRTSGIIFGFDRFGVLLPACGYITISAARSIGKEPTGTFSRRRAGMSDVGGSRDLSVPCNDLSPK